MTEETPSSKRWSIAHLAEQQPVDCPCGDARRAFTDDPDGTGHLVRDGEKVDVKPLDAILIKLGLKGNGSFCCAPFLHSA